EPANATQSFSSLKDPTVWQAIPVLEFLQQSWENMAAHKKFSTLDPNYKLEYAQSQWKSDAFDEGVGKLKAMFDQYHTPVAATPQPILVSSVSSRPSMVQYGHSWMHSAILSSSFNHVPNTCPHGMRLPGYSRFFNTVRTSLLKQWYHRPQSTQSTHT
ncbi:hypothetical protein BDR04DRAFT_1123431, partial [Suillus decipiens]